MHLARLILAALTIACWLAPSSPAQAPKPPPHVAIVPASEDKDITVFADLLTAAMAQASQGCELVERAELHRIAQEAEVQAMSAAERPRALARLAKADGLILLTLEKTDPKRPSIVARLSSASTGLIYKSFMLAAEEKDIPEAAKLAAEALRFPAERLSKAGSPPPLVISLLGFRAAVANSPGVAIETALNGAVAHHLSSIAGLAVVERWKLDDLAFERALSEKDMPPLATGTTLMDGSFEIKDKAALVKVRIRTTQQHTGKIIHIEGSADDAFTLAKSIATKVAEECGNHTAPAPWDTKAEASAYAKLGSWLLDHKMGREAAQAYESAVALGDNRSETLFKRIYAYLALPNLRGFTNSDSFGFQERSIFSPNCRAMEADKQEFPVVLASLNRATAYAEDVLQRPWKPYAGMFWSTAFQYTANLATMACHTLVTAHNLDLHVKYSTEIQTLRKRTEFLVRIHQKERESWIGPEKHALNALAGYWSGTPEEAAEYWRNLLREDKKRAPQELSLRRYELGRYLELEGLGVPMTIRPGLPAGRQRPIFVDWSTLDNARGEACWKKLLDEWHDSKSLIDRFNYIAFALYTEPSGEKHAKLTFDLLDFFEKNRGYVSQPEGQAAFCSFYPPLGPYGFPSGFAARYAGILAGILNDSSSVQFEVFARAKEMLVRFHRTKPGGDTLPKASAEKLIDAIRNYASHPNATRQSRNATQGPEGLLALITDAYPDLRKHEPPQLRIAAADGDAISVQLLGLEPITETTGIQPRIPVRCVGAYADRLLAVPIGSQTAGSQAHGLLCIEPDLTKVAIPPVPESLYHTRFDDPFPYRGTPLPAKNGFLTMTLHGTLLGYDFRAGRWSDQSDLLPEHLRDIYKTDQSAGASSSPVSARRPVGMINGTLYVANSSDDGLAIGRMVQGRYELISSTRRRPAEHSLDEVPPSKVGAFFPGNGERPCVLVRLPDRSEVHDLDRRQKIATFMTQSAISFDGKVAVISNDYMVAVIDPGSGNPRCLIRRPPEKLWANRVVQDDLPRETPWSWSSILSEGEVRPFVHGDCLFFLKYVSGAGANKQTGLKGSETGKLSLLCFKPERLEPLEIPLSRLTEALMDYSQRNPNALLGPSKSIVGPGDIQTTSTGMFFNMKMIVQGAGYGTSSPGILYLRWKQVDDWLTRHGHAPIGTRTTAGALSPSR